jgi:hypothetical protein
MRSNGQLYAFRFFENGKWWVANKAEFSIGIMYKSVEIIDLESGLFIKTKKINFQNKQVPKRKLKRIKNSSDLHTHPRKVARTINGKNIYLIFPSKKSDS